MKYLLSRIALFTVVFCTGFSAVANMADPHILGTYSGSGFFSQHAQVLHEDLSIAFSEDNMHASFTVVYHIRTDSDGVDLPLLFLAAGYEDGFNVSVDGVPLKVPSIQSLYKADLNTTELNYLTEKDAFNISRLYPTWFNKYSVKALQFQTDLTRGDHVIEVEYRAKASKDVGGIINDYFFHYALFPARYWQDFGTLTINIDFTAVEYPFSTNLGDPKTVSEDGISTWEFEGLPVDEIEIMFDPQPGYFVGKFSELDPLYWAITLVIIFGFFQFRQSAKLVRKRKVKWYHPVFTLGTTAVFTMYLLAPSIQLEILELALGEHLGNPFWYGMGVILSLPIVAIIYLGIFISWVSIQRKRRR